MPAGRRTYAGWPTDLCRLAGSGAALTEEAGFLDQGAVCAAGLGSRWGGLAGGRGGKVCATLASAPNGLQPVLAKGCEVD
jgi:hypothetical protein